LASAPHPAAVPVGSADSGQIAAGRPFAGLGPWFPFHRAEPEPLRSVYPGPASRAHRNCHTAAADWLTVRLPSRH
jgi:hypothetical protein